MNENPDQPNFNPYGEALNQKSNQFGQLIITTTDYDWVNNDVILIDIYAQTSLDATIE